MIFFKNNTKRPRIELVFEDVLSSWLVKVAECYNKDIGELNYTFVDADKILEVNKQYLLHDYVTDVITFNNSNGNQASADVFICLAQVLDQAKSMKISFENEFLRIMVHALLHLLGEDDTTVIKQKKMRKAEDKMIELFYSSFA
jgi:rRNA maturation RNase YbeY